MLVRLILASLFVFSLGARAQEPVKIGVLTDFDGAHAAASGRGALIAALMAAEDFGGKVLGRPIEVLQADHRNKPDVAVSLVGTWWLYGMDAVVDIANPAIAPGVLDLAKQQNRIAIVSGTALAEPTPARCGPTVFQWNWDGFAAGSLPPEALAINITDIHTQGLAKTEGKELVEGFYWDRDDASRAWAKRFQERAHAMPSQGQAGDYSAVTHYLKAVAAAGTTEPKAVAAKMHALPVEDFFAHGGIVRADGRMIHDMYRMRVKTPAESKAAWDYYTILETVPGASAFRPLEADACKQPG